MPIKRIHLVKHINIMVALVMKLLKITFLMAEKRNNARFISLPSRRKASSLRILVVVRAICLVPDFFLFGVFIDVKN